MTETPGPFAHRPLGYVPALDGLRAIAIGLVFFLHIYGNAFSGGTSGVDLFFVLSGFLITKLALDEHERSGSISRKDFYMRRAFRILPPVFVMLGVMLVISYGWLADVGGILRREILFSALSAGNLWALFYGSAPRSALGHTWTLGLEEQFYLVWPVILVVALTMAVKPARLGRAIVIASIASILVGRVVVAGIIGYPHWQSIPFFNFDGLAIGCLIAIFLHNDTRGVSNRLPRWPAALAALVMTADFFLARFYDARDTYDIRTLVLRIACGYILLVVVCTPDGWWTRPLTHPAVLKVGLWSYSLYLWHFPIFYLLQADRHPSVSPVVLTIAKAVLSIAAAILSYHFVERPAIMYGRRVRTRSVRARPALDGTGAD